MTDPDDIERVLTDGLRVNPLDDVAMARLRNAASREWVRSVEEQRSVRPARYRLWAVAAALVCVVLGASWLLRPAGPRVVFGAVARMSPGDAEAAEGLLRRHSLQAGASLNVGDLLTSHGPVLITLVGGGTLRVAPDTVLAVASANEITLRHGRIYLDFPPGGHAGALGVGTWAGTVEHVGTEFEVLSNDQVVRIRVREGQVALRMSLRQPMKLQLDAGTQLTADRNGGTARSTVQPYGRDWLWVAELAPDYEIEGQPLLNFLQWAARELGRPLKFSDPHAREVAERTILHGSVKGREPLDALSSVLSTTSLSYEIRGDTIWIQSGHGS